MYDFFRGIPVQLDSQGNMSLDVNGVGYRLRVSEYTRQAIPLDGSSIFLHARLVLREDEQLLFGFYDPAERAAFDLLTGVQGVGPAVAMAILSQLGVNQLRQSLIARDAATLKKVKGVGVKSAERMILELADKVERIPTAAPSDEQSAEGVIETATQEVSRDSMRTEAYRALITLGFAHRESQAALDASDVQESPEAYVRSALSILRRHAS